MSVDQVDVVDFIGLNKNSGCCSLAISDHLEWDDMESHLLTLQEKINSYLSFIESEEINAEYPDGIGKEKEISVIFKYPPIGIALDFLDEIKQIIIETGIGFSYSTLDEEN